MKKELINVIIYSPSDRLNKVEPTEVKNNFKEFQKLVGGYFDIPYVSEKLCEKNIDVYVNDEGRVIGLEPSIIIVDGSQMIDFIVGTCVFASHNDNGDTIGLNKEQVLFIQKNIFNNFCIVELMGKEPTTFPCIDLKK